LDYIRQIFGDLGPLLRSAVVILGVGVALTVTQRGLNRKAGAGDGKRFRNQLILLAGSSLGTLIVILGLPIEASTRNQLLNLIGLMFSVGVALSSSTILGNAMAGIMLKVVRNFRSGDFIRTADHFGRVTERGLFHTEIQTADRDLTTLPNMYLANTPVTVIRSSGTILDATVSLGYDLQRSRVEAQLLKAAGDLGLVEPFVQVLDLGDYSVTYRVAGLLEESKQLLAYRSRLRKAILDALHADGIEIVSPRFQNERHYDKSDTFIPPADAGHPSVERDAAPVEVVFDKAEEAETLDGLQFAIDSLTTRLDEARKAHKNETDESAKVVLAGQVETLEAEQVKLEAEIEMARKKETAD